jgi:Mg-chelatase subunit ChlD
MKQMKQLNMTIKKSALVFFIPLVLILTAVLPANGLSETAAGLRQPSGPAVEVVFVLDTTGSMSGLIAVAKEKIWSIANTLASADPAPQIRMGLVGYRDRGDAYVTKLVPLSSDLDAIYARLMQFQADGGGDTPESVNQALSEAVTKVGWRKPTANVYRVVFLVGDAPPHMDYQDDTPFAESCRLANQQGIVINAIQCGDISETTPLWQEIAGLAEGQYFHVSQSGNAMLSSSPYDTKIAELSRRLDGTRIYYGSHEQVAQMEARKKTADKIYTVAAPSAVAQRSVFNAGKAGAGNFLGEQELVQAVADGNVDIETISKEALPPELKKMDRKALKQYVEKRCAERQALRNSINELAKQRQTFLENQAHQQSETYERSFDAKVFNCIQKQAAGKNIIYSGGPVL